MRGIYFLFYTSSNIEEVKVVPSSLAIICAFLIAITSFIIE